MKVKPLDIFMATVVGIVLYFAVTFIGTIILPIKVANTIFWKYIVLKVLGVITLLYFYLVIKRGGGGELPNYDDLHTEKLRGFKEDDLTFTFETDAGKLKLGNLFRGVLILGGAGAGKTKSIIEPIIYQAFEKNFAGIMYDFKTPDQEERERMTATNTHNPTLGEIAAHAHSIYNSPVSLFFVNFMDLERSHRCNPLQPIYLRNPTFARQYAETVLKNTTKGDKENYFLDVAINYFAGVIWYLRCEAPQFCTLPHAVAMVVFCDLKDVLKAVSTNIEAESMVSSVTDAQGSDRTIANITSTLKNGLSKINSKEIAWVLSGDDFNLNINDPADPKFVIIGNNAQVQDALSPVISLLISSSLAQMNTQGKQKSIVILDEAPTLFIPNFDNTPATARSNKVASIYAAQDVSQMIDMYGETASQKIISNLGNQFFGQSNNVKTVQDTVSLFGRIDTVKVSYNEGSNKEAGAWRDKGYSRGSSYTTETRDILKASDITNLHRGEFLAKLVDANFQSVKAQFKPSKYGSQPSVTPFREISEKMLMDNFHAIRNDVRSLLTISPTTTNPEEQQDSKPSKRF